MDAEVKKKLAEKQQRLKQKEKKELRWLFGGITESQSDMVAIAIIIAVIAYWTYVKVDWEYTVFPRKLESSLTHKQQEAPLNTDSKMSFFSQPTTQGALEGAQRKGDSPATLAIFHSELILAHEHPYFNGTANHSLNDKLPRSRSDAFLQFAYKNRIEKILWFRPPWQRPAAFAREATVINIGTHSNKYCTDFAHEYFVSRDAYAPTSELDAPRSITIQTALTTDLYRRSVVFETSPKMVIAFDLSYFQRKDAVTTMLNSFEVDANVKRFLRLFVSEFICFPSDSKEVVSAVETLRHAFFVAFHQNAIQKPKDLFVSMMSPTLRYFCDGKGERHWNELHALFTMLPKNATKVVRKFGLPTEAFYVPTPDDLRKDMSAAEVVVRHTNWGAVDSLLMSDEYSERSHSELLKAFEQQLPGFVKAL